MQCLLIFVEVEKCMFCFLTLDIKHVGIHSSCGQLLHFFFLIILFCHILSLEEAWY